VTAPIVAASRGFALLMAISIGAKPIQANDHRAGLGIDAASRIPDIIERKRLLFRILCAIISP